MQDIFRADELHYTGLVFAGLASLKLTNYEEARGYYRRAVVVQPEGPLAWKVRGKGLLQESSCGATRRTVGMEGIFKCTGLRKSSSSDFLTQ